MVHEDSGAGVPAQDRIVVARRAEGLGLLIEGHRLPEAVVGRVTGAGAAFLRWARLCCYDVVDAGTGQPRFN